MEQYIFKMEGAGKFYPGLFCPLWLVLTFSTDYIKISSVNFVLPGVET